MRLLSLDAIGRDATQAQHRQYSSHPSLISKEGFTLAMPDSRWLSCNRAVKLLDCTLRGRGKTFPELVNSLFWCIFSTSPQSVSKTDYCQTWSLMRPRVPGSRISRMLRYVGKTCSSCRTAQNSCLCINNHGSVPNRPLAPTYPANPSPGHLMYTEQKYKTQHDTILKIWLSYSLYKEISHLKYIH